MTMDLDNALDRIRTDLATLRSRDHRGVVFGSKSHHYELNATLAVEAAEAFEKEHGVELPVEYRRFLTEIGDGGAGPAYGVHPLSGSFHNPWMTLGTLATPVSQPDSKYEGCLLVSQRGCGGWTFLIVSGQARGQVWYDDTVVGRGFTLASEDFLTWYAGWLRSSLETVEQQPKDGLATFIEDLTAVTQNAPDRLGEVLEQLPEEGWLLGALMFVAFNSMQQPANALLIYNRLYRFPVPEKGGRLRPEYLKAVNNGCIAACLVQDFENAAAIADMAQPFIPENPYIAHSAACAYMGFGDADKALEQCRLAVQHEYEHLDQLAKDTDLAPLFDRPEFLELFGPSSS